jgi:hypothetical protein
MRDFICSKNAFELASWGFSAAVCDQAAEVSSAAMKI